jgi:hypothetical protein
MVGFNHFSSHHLPNPPSLHMVFEHVELYCTPMITLPQTINMAPPPSIESRPL